MASAAEVEFDLATVKQLTQQMRSFGFDNAEDLIFQWRLENNGQILLSKAYSSDLFQIHNSDLIGKLIFTYSNINYYTCSLSLNLFDWENDEKINALYPLQFFVCKFKLSFRDAKNTFLEDSFYSMNAFNLFNAVKNELFFKCHKLNVTNVVIELYQEPLARIEYRSPHVNAVVGKMEKFKEIKERAAHSLVLSVSPRFNFGSPDQLMFVRFFSRKLANSPNFPGLSAALHIVGGEGESRGAPFAFTATFTVFAQMEGVKDLVYKIFYRRDEMSEYLPILLAFTYELEKYLENDTQYYKVVVEPHPTKCRIPKTKSVVI